MKTDHVLCYTLGITEDQGIFKRFTKMRYPATDLGRYVLGVASTDLCNLIVVSDITLCISYLLWFGYDNLGVKACTYVFIHL